MGPFPPSKDNLYILVAVDYVSKWVEAIARPKNDVKTMVKFFQKNILTRFGAPRAIVSNEGIHFYNKVFAPSWPSMGSIIKRLWLITLNQMVK